MQFWQLLGDLHPKLVQFPLVLLLAGLIFDVCGLLARSPRCHFAAKALSAAGTFSLLRRLHLRHLRRALGGSRRHPAGADRVARALANVASWGFVVLMAWRMFLHDDNATSAGRLHGRRSLLVRPAGRHGTVRRAAGLRLWRRRHRGPRQRHPHPSRSEPPRHPPDRRQPPLLGAGPPRRRLVDAGPRRVAVVAAALFPVAARQARVGRAADSSPRRRRPCSSSPTWISTG